MLKRLRTVCAVALLTVGTYAAAVETRGDHPDTYVVKKGDTLWDIAGTFLKRPWLWPEIWQANPQIQNPHLIYPGDVISLAYLDRVAVQEGPRAETPVTGVPLSEVEPFLKNLRVMDQFEQLPYVVALEEDRLRANSGHAIYVRGLAGAQPGARFAVIRPTVEFTRLDRGQVCCDIFFKQDLDFRGRRIFADYENMWTSAITPDQGQEHLGFELVQVTTGSLSQVEGNGHDVSTLVVDAEGREVRAGDRIVPVEAQPYDLQFFPHPPKQQFEYGRARVIAVADLLQNGGPRDVIALSVGARDGIDNGTVFSIWRVGSNVPDRVEYGNNRSEDLFGDASRVRLPDEFAGHVMVFKTYDKVSYGLIMSGIKPTKIGYELKHPDAPY
ncbi:LysM peptidoglycan-binding domain-containing protein [Lysobacter sp. A6]|uniref:LysM peptidoglycan-binding domain-containing protein n=1 Tax=Noviluteimonas lactosilytica TaxID=2888523 RepID=A0ABS8JHH8_9GAMM|nr:LysM domain-containing protein [Lysobacter lactosilyticus]MCC8362938.1 LysM peptidoglycan-binding domain-containing protein [Lysobacter lactosilyticus]